MKARGKRERSERVAPGNKAKANPALKGRNTRAIISAFQASSYMGCV